jgi:uncharacterized protein (UPF0212 family)
MTTPALSWMTEAGSRLMDEADLTIDLCTPHADAMSTIEGLDRTAVITRTSVVGAERSRILFEEAYREHARRIARAIGGQTAGG